MSKRLGHIDFGRIGLWVLTGCAVFALLLLTTPDWHALEPVAQAAWVQAVGTIVAVAIAIAVPWRIDKIRRDERQAVIDHEADLLAAELRKRVTSWKERAKQMAGLLDAASTRDEAFRAIDQNNFLEASLAEYFEKVHILGQGGRSLVAASVYWRRLNTIAESLHSTRLPLTADEVQESIKDAQRFSRRMATELDRATSDIFARLEKIAPEV